MLSLLVRNRYLRQIPLVFGAAWPPAPSHSVRAQPTVRLRLRAYAPLPPIPTSLRDSGHALRDLRTLRLRLRYRVCDPVLPFGLVLESITPCVALRDGLRSLQSPAEIVPTAQLYLTREFIVLCQAARCALLVSSFTRLRLFSIIHPADCGATFPLPVLPRLCRLLRAYGLQHIAWRCLLLCRLQVTGV